jgi:hypothetical protein
MSEPTVAALVCEGQTDVPIFREIIRELWPSIEQVFSLQPELDETERARGRAGWSEVKSWCKQHASQLDEVLDPFVGDRIDILLVAIDLDIAIEAGIADPPQSPGPYESNRLKASMRKWLLPAGKRHLPASVVLSTPTMAVEAWVVAVIFPRQLHPERLSNPAEFLVEKRKLRPSPRDQKPWKEMHLYRAFASQVAKNLKRVRTACPEAERTCRAIEQIASR